ncbi:MAG: multicopper oxidase domain-containing protein, partial [bacterium]|nr:multicopper oxidase domain-containing protein [bacterium]
MLKYGGVGAAVLTLNASGFLAWPDLSQMLSSGQIASPLVTPFTLPLRIPPVIQPVGTVQVKDRFDEATLNELEEVRLKLLEEGMKVDMSVADHYVLRQQVTQVQILPPGMPKTTIWGYNGITPGPTFRVKRGKPVVVTHINELPVRTCAHPHGLDVQSASDGHPAFLLAPAVDGSPARFPTRPFLPGEAQGCGEEPQEEKFGTVHEERQDHFYPNMQEAAPLWYHDHSIHRTGRNVYMGLAGFYLIEDDVEQSLSLPGNPRFDDQREFDVPLVLQDRLIGEDGSLIYPCDGDRPARQGVFGDVILVNGVPMPFLEVKRRKYRFRFLNGSNARLYRLALSTGEPFTVIASDGGLLHKPVTTPEILISMSERYEAIIDFKDYPIGTQVILENRFGRAFGDPIDEEKTRQIMRFDVVEDADDPSSIPSLLRPRPFADELPESSAVRTRDFRFERRGGFWTINGEIFEIDR